ncbi:18S rRNA biogenesis protein [Ascobolus immersus RN42]|uniref:18S rRNA biogenesis protein n=1 Tax=Ascobolus immersus RN42 TaxID=1160509 RepID=A0A3N4HF12_ASCIM|nr:18S rRNA biogenesis protein [Ascobolus immersus RN42]
MTTKSQPVIAAPLSTQGPLKLTTPSLLRTRLLLATLTGRALHITSIRPNSLTPGLTPAEISLLRLLDTLTNGSHLEISLTGTSLYYRPGLLTANGGKPITHTIPSDAERGVTWYLEALAILAPFCKAKLDVTLKGGVITASTPLDYSVDTFRSVVLPALAKAGIERSTELRVLRRSSASKTKKGALYGAGEVQFLCGHQVRIPKTVHLTTAGRIKRIRGVAYATGLSGSVNARTIEAARGVVNRFVADVYIYSDVGKACIVKNGYGEPGKEGKMEGTKKCGVGYGISLVAETTLGGVFSGEASGGEGEAAEDVGRRAAYALLEEVGQSGAFGKIGLRVLMTMMAMGQEGDVGRICVGREQVDEELVGLWRDLKAICGGQVAIRDAEDARNGELIIGVVGRGVGNVGRKVA